MEEHLSTADPQQGTAGTQQSSELDPVEDMSALLSLLAPLRLAQSRTPVTVPIQSPGGRHTPPAVRHDNAIMTVIIISLTETQ